MIFFLANGIKLDVASPSFRMDMESPIFAAREEVIPPAYSLPIDIILDAKARALFKYQDLPAAATLFREIEDVQLYIKGTPFMTGKLLLISITRNIAQCSFATNNLQKVKDVKIDELDLGKYDLAPQPPGDIRSHMTATTLNPDIFNHIFVPVYNPSYYDQAFYDFLLEKPKKVIRDTFDFFNRRMQNAWEGSNFLYNEHSMAITPFVKIFYVYKKIFEYIGIDYEDKFWDAELKRMYFYNNTSINTIKGDLETEENLFNSPTDSIVYTSHVPDIKVTDLIKEMNLVFTTVLVPKLFRKGFTLRYIKDIVKDSQKIDWSTKVVEIDVNYQGEQIGEVGYDTDSADNWFVEPSAKTIPYNLTVEYDQQANIWKSIGTLTGINIKNHYWYLKLKSLFYSISGSKIMAKIIPLFDGTTRFFANNYIETKEINNILIDNKTYFTGRSYIQHMPVINTPGNINYVDQDKKAVTQSSDKLSPRIIFYRGYFTDRLITPTTYPFASANIYKPLNGSNTYSELATKHSLLWSGKHGLQEKAQPYYDLIKDGRIIRAKCVLHITDLLNFEWDSKIKIMSNNYLVQKLQFELLSDGSFLTDLYLVRTH
jgi:hypothetical protein